MALRHRASMEPLSENEATGFSFALLHRGSHLGGCIAGPIYLKLWVKKQNCRKTGSVTMFVVYD